MSEPMLDNRVIDAELLARHPERSMEPIVGDSKCHHGVPEWSGGLCRACWSRRHDPDPAIIAAKLAHQRELNARWYAENAARKRATQKAQYARYKAEAEALGMKTYVYRKMMRDGEAPAPQSHVDTTHRPQ